MFKTQKQSFWIQSSKIAVIFLFLYHGFLGGGKTIPLALVRSWGQFTPPLPPVAPPLVVICGYKHGAILASIRADAGVQTVLQRDLAFDRGLATDSDVLGKWLLECIDRGHHVFTVHAG